MERLLMEKMVLWKSDPNRKPLILKGARQVGKTWLMQEFGKRYYHNYVYFNFDEEEDIKTIFKTNKDPERIIEILSLISNEAFLPEETLIVFDEIQECSEALNTLKYFHEKANNYHIVTAGSLLGTYLAYPHSYPVGQVNIMDITPLSFEEFLLATDERLYRYVQSIQKGETLLEIFHNRLLESYRYYLIIGGMPECVLSWVNDHDPQRIMQIQQELLTIYEFDITKHNSRLNSGRILMVLRSIVSQLAKENEKFVYGAVRHGGRARDFKEAIEWLISAGLVTKVNNVSKIEQPLPAFDKLDSFKLYFFDTGLLKSMAGVTNKAIMLEEDFQFKGPLVENYVLQQVKSLFNVSPRYYSDRNGEIDFIIQSDSSIFPVEVKAGTSKRAKSFKKYVNEKQPDIAIRFCEMNYLENGLITNVPLYLANRLDKLI